jgi:hypothetical protein
MFDQQFLKTIKQIVKDAVKECLVDAEPVTPRWVGYKKAAIRLDLTEAALRQRMAAGQIPQSCYSKLEGSIRFDLPALDDWMDGLKSA